MDGYRVMEIVNDNYFKAKDRRIKEIKNEAIRKRNERFNKLIAVLLYLLVAMIILGMMSLRG